MIVHGGLICLDRRGVLIIGPSGAGKSDLALRAMDMGFHLVADDRTLVWVSGGRLYGRAPDSIAGRIEVRGLGVIEACALGFVQIVMVAACVERVERLPEPDSQDILGVPLPRFDLLPLEASAPAKLRHALIHLGERS